MEKEIRQRLQWVKLYEESGDAGLICRRCGISRPTLRKWWKRCQAQGINGLKSQSRRPHSSPSAKIGPDHEKLILELRSERNLGARCRGQRVVHPPRLEAGGFLPRAECGRRKL